MRSKKEIDDALFRLTLLPNNAARRAQIEVLTGCRSESWVFDKYVRNAPAGERDEDVFYAARDAAQFVAGKLELDAVLEINPLDDEQQDGAGEVTVPKALFQNLMERVAQLEKDVQSLRGEKTFPAAAPKPAAGEAFLTGEEAAYHIGCSYRTLSMWRKKGLVTGHKKGNFLFYLPSELAASDTVKRFRKMTGGKRP